MSFYQTGKPDHIREEVASVSDRKKKILICDDSLLIRKKMIMALENIGDFDLIEAVDGNKVVDLYTREKPDLVLLDLVMPEQDGLKCLEKIKFSDHKAYIVMITSTGTKENLQKALTLGADDFLQKPWNDQDLSNIISKLTGGDTIV